MKGLLEDCIELAQDESFRCRMTNKQWIDIKGRGFLEVQSIERYFMNEQKYDNFRRIINPILIKIVGLELVKIMIYDKFVGIGIRTVY